MTEHPKARVFLSREEVIEGVERVRRVRAERLVRKRDEFIARKLLTRRPFARIRSLWGTEPTYSREEAIWFYEEDDEGGWYTQQEREENKSSDWFLAADRLYELAVTEFGDEPYLATLDMAWFLAKKP